jgi:predicted transcriptional regulator YdeE
MRTVIDESGAEGALVYREPPRTTADARRGRGNCRRVAFPPRACVRRRDRIFGDALCPCAPSQRGCAGARRRRTRRVGKVAYGVCCNGDDSGNFDYIAGVEVSDFSDLPREFSRVRIPQARYAVFSHKDHISTIRRTVNTVWNHWLPASGLKAADAPSFERYGENFDPLTGNGGLEIWVPVRE